MARFRKKPIEVEAWQVQSREFAPRWLSAAMMAGNVRAVDSRTDHLEIETLEGTMLASPGDWIIQGVRGELYPCRGDIFAETYEAVE